MFYFFIGYVFLTCWFYLVTLFGWLFKQPAFGQRKAVKTSTSFPRHPKKPEWVCKEVIRMKAMMPDLGCRMLSNSFNRRFRITRKMTVSKSYVNDLVRDHQYEIQVLRRKIKHRIPRLLPLNKVWGIDLTGKTDAQGKTHNIFGIIEHGSRANFTLAALKDKASITLLRCLLDAIEKYGKPTIVRTDNESCFTSKLFSIGLWLLGIKHQRIDKGCPWMGALRRKFGRGRMYLVPERNKRSLLRRGMGY